MSKQGVVKLHAHGMGMMQGYWLIYMWNTESQLKIDLIC